MFRLDRACEQVELTNAQRIDCTLTNPVASATCSYDGGEEEDCSFPLTVTTERFGTNPHIVVVTATDGFGQTSILPLYFRLATT